MTHLKNHSAPLINTVECETRVQVIQQHMSTCIPIHIYFKIGSKMLRI